MCFSVFKFLPLIVPVFFVILWIKMIYFVIMQQAVNYIMFIKLVVPNFFIYCELKSKLWFFFVIIFLRLVVPDFFYIMFFRLVVIVFVLEQYNHKSRLLQTCTLMFQCLEKTWSVSVYLRASSLLDIWVFSFSIFSFLCHSNDLVCFLIPHVFLFPCTTKKPKSVSNFSMEI